MRPDHARILINLSFVPLSVAFAITLGRAFDAIPQQVAIWSTGLIMLANVWLWHRFIRWSRLRTMSALTLTLLVVGQVLIWQPLWPDACTQEPQCIAQSIGALGVWLFGCALIWWSDRLGGTGKPSREGPKMSPSIARLVVMGALIPLLSGLFYVVGYAESKVIGWDSTASVVCSFWLCQTIAILVPLLLWRRVVLWTRRRIGATVILAAIFLLTPVFLMISALDEMWLEETRGLWPLFGWGIWLIGIAVVWRTDDSLLLRQSLSGARNGDLAVCGACGYPLTGLREVRCPECGWTSTVDRVVADVLQAVADSR